MNRRLALSIGLGALLAGRIASAQEEVTIGYQGLPYKSTGESNTGIQVSEGVLLHAGVGAEFGYDTNVFYAPTNLVGSSIIRVMPYLDLTNATRTGPVSKELTFDARAGLQYRHYGSSAVSSTYADAWNPNAGLTLGLGGAQFGFGIADVFARIEDAPYAGIAANANGLPGTPPIQRTNNQASIEGRWSPGGGRLTSTLRFTNMVNLYDNNGNNGLGTYNYANALTNSLMLDQFSLILGAHVLKTYAGLPPLGVAKRGGLAPWQKRRAAEMIRERLDGNIRLSQLARECGLSVSHFTRAFRKSFGVSPYRWLLERRIDYAKALLLTSDLPIANIALQSGFSDQAAFTRAFGRIVGDSPGRWKRAVTSRA